MALFFAKPVYICDVKSLCTISRRQKLLNFKFISYIISYDVVESPCNGVCFTVICFTSYPTALQAYIFIYVRGRPDMTGSLF
jgi:hypothetical protein